MGTVIDTELIDTLRNDSISYIDPPTIPAGMTVADYRRARPHRNRLRSRIRMVGRAIRS